MKKLLFIIFALSFFGFFTTANALAALAPDCTVVYGGGIKDNCVKMERTIPTPQYGNEPEQTTKGGLPVYPAPAMNHTPATGAELLGLLGLVPAAGAGLLLRKGISK